MLGTFYIPPIYGDETVFEVTTTSADEFVSLNTVVSSSYYFSAGFKSGVNSCWIDWGDGTAIEYWRDNHLGGSATQQSSAPCHLYRTRGTYTVRLSDSFSNPRFYCSTNGPGRITRVVRYGASVTSLLYSFGYNNDLVEIPEELPDRITNLNYAFSNCPALKYPFRSFNKATNVSYAFSACTGLLRCPEDWGTGSLGGAAYATRVFSACTSITEPMDTWPNGTAYTSIGYFYNGCTSLSRFPAQPWPSNSKCVTANFVYSGCTSLRTTIPAWGPYLTSVSSCYNGCSGLTGVWDPTAPDSELMPAKITTKTNCFTNASAAVRAYFTSAWGGTKA